MANYIFKIYNLEKYKSLVKKISKTSHAVILQSKDDILVDAIAKLVVMQNECMEKDKPCFICSNCQKILDGNALDISYCNKLIDCLSGGEKQRVDLILQLAIRDLLTSYFNFNSNILVLDEITDFLDAKACGAIMNLLSTVLKNVESVFIISHHSDELAIPIDTEIKVIKNSDGISEIS